MPVGIGEVEHKAGNRVNEKEGKAADRGTSWNISFHLESS